MPIQFYNSLTRKKEPFVPLEEGKVRLYTCGPTVYDVAHIGNFRTFLFEDLLKRFLRFRGFEVYHVMNITDVDDKTIQRAGGKRERLAELTKQYSDFFFEDLKRLDILPADQYPRATGHIQQMIEMIQSLVDRGFAYRMEDGSVFFSIDSYKDYGRLVKLDFSAQKSTERVSTDEYDLSNPQDFALWKAWKEEDGDIYWDSPWGRGRPGWHIECSAMSTVYLGDHFDIHCGGVDNLFPHHENEIAQTVCATGAPFVNYWLHSEHLTVESGKMSKSAGNFYGIQDLLSKGMTTETFILLSAHYRSKVQFSPDRQPEAARALQRITELKKRLSALTTDAEIKAEKYPEDFEQFSQALGDDLNTPEALAVFFEWIRKTNLLLDRSKVSPEAAEEGLNFISAVDSILRIVPGEQPVPEDILSLVRQREEARKNKDWKRADEIREQLLQAGWKVKDTAAGSEVTRS
jgi:cysteinyl-tRNA synthetase